MNANNAQKPDPDYDYLIRTDGRLRELIDRLTNRVNKLEEAIKPDLGVQMEQYTALYNSDKQRAELEKIVTQEPLNTMIKEAYCSNDPVNHPKHYTSSLAKCMACGCPIECIDISTHYEFSLGNVIKYIWRYKDKDGLEGLKKAQWYLNDFIKRAEANDQTS